MFGNGCIKSISDQIADHVLEKSDELNESQSRDFFEWLNQHIMECSFDHAEEEANVRLRAWISIQPITLMILEYRIILSKLESIKRICNA